MNWSLPAWKKPKKVSEEILNAEELARAAASRGGQNLAKANRVRAKAQRAIRRRNAEKRTT